MTTSTSADRLRRAGLGVDINRDGTCHYQPDGAFFVDGIRYTHPGCLPRTIISLIKLHECPSTHCRAGARMVFSTPLTGAEVDRWVRTGHFPSTEP